MARRRQKERKVPTRQQLVKALVDKWAFADLIDFHGGSKAFGECHRDLATWQDNDSREHRRQLILMPRGHLKTTISTVLDILWALYVNPNLRIFVGSANQALSKAILREIMANFTDNWLQENVWNNRPHIEGRLVPVLDSYGRIERRKRKTAEGGDVDEMDMETDDDKKVIWRQDLGIQLIRPDKLKEPTVVIGSVQSPATGFHYDRLYFDDIINFDNYDKPDKVERLDIWRDDMFNVLDDSWYDEDLYDALCKVSRSEAYRAVFRKHCNVGGDIIVVGTRYFKHDWYKKLLDREGEDADEFTCYLKNIYKNGDDNSDGYLWHERWTERTEKQRRSQTSTKNFNAQYLNKIVVDEEQVIPWCKMKTMNPAAIIRRDGQLRLQYETEKERLDIVPHIVIDPAATSSDKSDYTAIWCGGKDRNGDLYLFDLWCGKESSVKWIKRVFDMCRKWNIKRVHLETVGFAKELKTTFRLLMPADYPVAVIDHNPTGRTGKKERIENGLQPMLDNGKIYSMPWMSRLDYVTDQFDFFPQETVKDDAPDALQMLNEVAKVMSLRLTNDNSHLQVNNRYGGLR